MKHLSSLLSAVVLLGSATTAFGHEASTPPAPRADGHAPIGIMGDHMHNAGEWMLSYRYMHMSMSGNIHGSNSIDDATIVTEIANPFSGMAMMPPTLRVVPQDMSTRMHMLGMMYAPSDRVTLMVMANYIEKSMTLTSYQGMSGTTPLGQFEARSNGFGDTVAGALVRAWDSGPHHLHFNLSLRLPTGAIDKEDDVLTPMNTRMTMRLPYGMQLGSGSYSLVPGVTYTGSAAPWTWGSQYKATVRLNDNDEHYRLGDEHQLQAWTQYALTSAVSTGLTLSASSVGEIEGRDPAIMAPVQTADPRNYGGEQLLIKWGLNWVGQQGALYNHRLALDYAVPLYHKANGLQMEMDKMVTLGYQYAF